MSLPDWAASSEQPNCARRRDDAVPCPSPGPLHPDEPGGGAGAANESSQTALPPPGAEPVRVDSGRWEWSAEHRDYIQRRGGDVLLYRQYQRSGRGLEMARQGSTQSFREGAEMYRRFSAPVESSVGPRPWQQRSEPPSPQLDLQARFQALRIPPQAPPAQLDLGFQLPGAASPSRARPPAPFDMPPDPRFRAVEKPKRFFSVGRIFKCIWFEPGGHPDPPPSPPAAADYTQACPAFHGQRPFAKFRWFVVVRKRLHHSLCFTITTFGGRGATKASRGRARDFVVLHSAAVEPPAPLPEEGITRAPVAVIIEDAEQYISPFARLDCSRVYTVEDNILSMKLGRVHPDSLELLESYYRESVT